VSHGTLWERLVRGSRWTFLAERYRSALPADFDACVMELRCDDRYHAKQGRSTARVRFDSPGGSISAYLKRHLRLPWTARLAALVDPAGGHSPAAAELAHLERARRLGIAVPDVVAAGERIGPWGRLQSYLLVAELVGRRELNEILPEIAERLPADDFARLKRAIVREMVDITATLHGARLFHKDLYLCHFFLDASIAADGAGRLTLIDLHRLGEHRWTAARWRWKDLGQLLFSTYGVAGIEDRDRLRFWALYRRRLALWVPELELRAIRRKAARYLAHNRPGGSR
jgi:heptose I phosphotransferase